LASKNQFADNWYPRDEARRAQVDEYLQWQANNIRVTGAMFFYNQWLMPKLTGQAPDTSILEFVRKSMEASLDVLEYVWLSEPSKRFLASTEISFADVMLCCDLEQIRITGYNPFSGRPNLENLWKRVKELTSPFYNDAHAVCYKMTKSPPKL